MLSVAEIHFRDPFVLPVPEEHRYYLYGTTGRETWSGKPEGFDCYWSEDLENWHGPFPAFRPPQDFWADRHFWAPEVHRWENRFVMLASFKSESACRGTSVLLADHPRGPFRLHSPGPVTPLDWECLDGTLWWEDRQPWMVFCHEWVQVGDGEICAVPLSADLRAAVGDPRCLFHASEASWTVEFAGEEKGRSFTGRVTDGPFLYRAENGKLLMLWSSFGSQGYAMGIAHSQSGHLAGPWQQAARPLYARDGGHGMLFRTFAGQLLTTLHRPNQSPDERPVFLPIDEGELNL